MWEGGVALLITMLHLQRGVVIYTLVKMGSVGLLAVALPCGRYLPRTYGTGRNVCPGGPHVITFSNESEMSARRYLTLLLLLLLFKQNAKSLFGQERYIAISLNE